MTMMILNPAVAAVTVSLSNGDDEFKDITNCRGHRLIFRKHLEDGNEAWRVRILFCDYDAKDRLFNSIKSYKSFFRGFLEGSLCPLAIGAIIGGPVGLGVAGVGSLILGGGLGKTESDFDSLLPSQVVMHYYIHESSFNEEQTAFRNIRLVHETPNQTTLPGTCCIENLGQPFKREKHTVNLNLGNTSFTWNNLIRLNNIADIVSIVSQLLDNSGKFPMYMRKGFDYEHDVLNCNTFAIRVLDKIGVPIRDNCPDLSIFLEHSYAEKKWKKYVFKTLRATQIIDYKNLVIDNPTFTLLLYRNRVALGVTPNKTHLRTQYSKLIDWDNEQ